MVLAGCAQPGISTPSEESGRDWPVTGLVTRAVTGGAISIAHDDIRGYMPAMTMTFPVGDTREAERLVPGDRVRFILSVTGATSRAHAFQVIGRDPSAPGGGRQTASGSAARLRPGDPLPSFALVDQDGRALNDAFFQGHRTALTFIFTRCPVPEFCPRVTGYFRELQRAVVQNSALGDVRLLSVSLDPAFDTPEVLRVFGQSMSADFRRWHFATGPAEQVAILTRAFALRADPSPAILDHTLATAVVGPDGRVVEIWRGNGWTPDEVLAALRR
jgi:protein SCO1/2